MMATMTRARAATTAITASRQAGGLDDVRWSAVVARDGSRDGEFVYSVASTGVYCRPSCPSRLAHRDNVRFHATPDDAKRAGFRPCKRCRPDTRSQAEEQARLVADACRTLIDAETPPTLAALAAAAGLSPHHFHRLFKSVTGTTPKAFAGAERHRRMREALAMSGSVTDAIYDAGFASSGRFYAETEGALGMRPSDYRAGGHGIELRYATGRSTLGVVLVAWSPRGIAAILLGDAPEALVDDLRKRYHAAKLVPAGRERAEELARVVDFVDAPRHGLDLPLDLQGTAFQLRVWQALRSIPSGETATYGEIAHRIGAPNAVRAVGAACGANPAAVAVPCHRIVGADGRLTGYRWGVERKRTLLAREASGGALPKDKKR